VRSAPLLLPVLAALAWGAPSAAPVEPAPDRARAAAEAGIRYLLSIQNSDGSFGSHAQGSPYKIRAAVPGGTRAFHAASTSLALMALLAAPGEDPALLAARSRAADWVVKHGRARRADGEELYAVWALAYGLQAISRCLSAPPSDFDPGAARAAAARMIESIVRYQTLDGGWTYYDFNAQTARPSGDSMTFTSAAILIALHEARAAGLTVPAPVIARGVRSLARCRTREGMYVYSYDWRMHPASGINRRPGSLTRTPACDLALHLFDGGVSREAMLAGVENLAAKAPFARMAYHRPVPHESWFAVSGYFYLFGYHYAGEVLKRLPGPVSPALRDALIEEVLYTRHPDGSFWDYQLYGYHKVYGTAYAVTALLAFIR
jgi:hypothetical protein